jgi:hypothetical protein
MKYLMLLLITVRNMSAGQLQQVIGAGVSATSGQSEQTQQIWNQAYGVGSQVG